MSVVDNYSSLMMSLDGIKKEVDDVVLGCADEITDGVVSGLLKQASDSILGASNFVKYMMARTEKTKGEKK